VFENKKLSKKRSRTFRDKQKNILIHMKRYLVVNLAILIII